MGKKLFLNAVRGTFSEKPTPGKFTEVLHELTGHLVNINFKETPYGEAMRLHIIDENNFYIISMFVESRVATAFFMLAKNLVLQHEMTFRIKQVDDKDFFSIEQFGGPVLWYYTRENKYDLPMMPEDRRPFLKEMVETEIIPVLHKKLNPYPCNQMYKPMRKGLQGGYFDAYKSNARMIGPMGENERNELKNRWNREN